MVRGLTDLARDHHISIISSRRILDRPLEIILVESPHYLRRTFDPASGLALLDLSSETPTAR